MFWSDKDAYTLSNRAGVIRCSREVERDGRSYRVEKDQRYDRCFRGTRMDIAYLTAIAIFHVVSGYVATYLLPTLWPAWREHCLLTRSRILVHAEFCQLCYRLPPLGSAR